MKNSPSFSAIFTWAFGLALASQAQTWRVYDLAPGAYGEIVEMGQPLDANRFIFRAFTPGDRPWVTDGTLTGTFLLAPAQDLGGANGLSLAANGRYYFGVWSALGVPSLWYTDGTTPGTAQVANANFTVSPVFINGRGITMANHTSPNDVELFVLDPTGTRVDLLKDINPSSLGSDPDWFTPLGNYIYFAATDGTQGTELWRTDGTAAGTTLVADVNPGAGHSYPEKLVPLGGRLLFAAFTHSRGTELWITDGAITSPVADIWPGSGDPGILSTPVIMGGVAYFTAQNNATNRELWRTDGTAGGTWRVADIRPGSDGSDPQWLTVVGNTLYFTADDGTHGRELWMSDGTAGGTRLVRDLNPGPGAAIDNFAFPSPLVNHRGVLAFAANDGIHGIELWETLGTVASTRLVADVNPGPVGSSPTNFLSLGNRLYFSAAESDPQFGEDLWATLDISDLTPLPIELTHFTAQPTAEGVELAWGTATELPGVRYVPERSPDGRTFTPLGQVAGTGQGQYVFTDPRPLSTLSYYRVRAQAANGEEITSRLVAVQPECTGLALRAWPQPATDRVEVTLPPGEGPAELRLVDALGRCHWQANQPTGTASLAIDLRPLPAGLYWLQVSSGARRLARSIVKQ
jgi:ELWxxDGT repeat protein